jgi:hypothetical protein
MMPGRQRLKLHVAARQRHRFNEGHLGLTGCCAT